MLENSKCLLILGSVLHLVLLTVPLAIEDWISQGSGSSEWHGSLTKITDAPSSFSHNWDSELYGDLSDYYCDEEDEEGDWPYDTDTLNGTLCDTFDNIKSGGDAFIATSSICLLMWLIVTILMASTFKRRPTRCCESSMYALSSLICIIYIIGYIIWMEETKLNFSDVCDDVYDDDIFHREMQNTCAESGTKFAFATLTLNIVYAALFICLMRKRVHGMDIPYAASSHGTEMDISYAPMNHETPHPYVVSGAPNAVYQNYPNQYYNPTPQHAQYASPSAPYYPSN